MVTANSLLNFVNGAEDLLRLGKLGESYVSAGYRLTSAIGFRNCELWLKDISVLQNFVRLFKAADLYVKMHNNLDKDPSAPYIDPITNQKSVGKKGNTGFKALAYLSPGTLFAVAGVGFAEFLGSRQIVPISDHVLDKLRVFLKYGGGLWGNGIAAFGGFYAARDLRQADPDDPTPGDKQYLGGSKYALDFVASALELFLDKNGLTIFGVKSLSRHVAVLQSIAGSFNVPLWTNALKLVGAA